MKIISKQRCGADFQPRFCDEIIWCYRERSVIISSETETEPEQTCLKIRNVPVSLYVNEINKDQGGNVK